MIKHFIITRHNYPKNYPYLRERMQMMRIAAAFLNLSTNKNFVWIIQSNNEIIDYPEFHELAENGMLKQVGFNNQSKVKDIDIDTIIDFITKKIENPIRPGDKLITSRVDDDDILLPNYVKDVQQIAMNCDIDTIIDLKGYWLDKREEPIKYYYNHRYSFDRTSPFISLVENLEEGKPIRTAYYIHHAKMGKHFNVFESPNHSWIQVLHKYNQKMNKLKPQELGRELTESEKRLLE